jgi:hypothetical protein
VGRVSGNRRDSPGQSEPVLAQPARLCRGIRTRVDDLKRLNFEAVLDGEVVVIDEQGHARFQLLQNYRKTGEGTCCIMFSISFT